MSAWKRGFLEIVAEILESLSANPLKKTHITFKCNLDSRAVSKYLLILTHVGLVETSKTNPSFYVITQKGINYRNHFRSFLSLMENDLQDLAGKSDEIQQLLPNLKIPRF
jgi:predicted transcriptional regulator